MLLRRIIFWIANITGNKNLNVRLKVHEHLKRISVTQTQKYIHISSIYSAVRALPLATEHNAGEGSGVDATHVIDSWSCITADDVRRPKITVKNSTENRS